MSDYPKYYSEYTGKYIDETITEARKMLENESDRVSAEDLRNNAEARRNEAEAARVAAEAERVTAEGNRTTAESSRVTAEAAREAAEQARADGATGIEAGRKAAAQSAFIARLWAEGMPGAPIIVLDELEETTVSAGALSGVVSTLLNSGYYLYDGLDYAITVNGETSIVMAENQTLKAKGFEVRVANGQLILDNSAGTEPVTISIKRISALPELPDTSAREEAERAAAFAAEAAERKKEMEQYVDDALDGITEERLATIESQIADILYEPITISSFGHNAGTRELGEVVEAVTLTWATSKAPAALELDGEAIDAALTSKRLEGLSLTETTSWKLVATDERGATTEKTATLSFVNGIYHGAAAEPENVDSAFILGLTKTLSGNKNRTVSIHGGDGLYAWYAYPKRLGTSLFSIGGFDYEYERKTVLFTNQHGYQEYYYVYRSGQYAPASLSVTVKNGG